MKVLLTTINSKYIHQNLAIRLLYELNRNYDGLSIQEFDSKTDPGDVIDFCSTYDLIAFSCYIWNITQILYLSGKIKQRNPACKILLGGPEVSYDWEEIISLPDIDYIILGEGEIPFSTLLNSYSSEDPVPGLVWKKDGEIFNNKLPDFLDLQIFQRINPYISIPFGELKNKICYIEASRGCPNCCEFCLAGLDKKVRYLPLETIQANLLYLMGKGRIIKFLDRTFNTNPAFAISIFQFILNHYKPGNIFQFEIKADIIQNELISFIKSNVPKGIFRFEIGIQTLNAKSNIEIKRKQNFENIKSFISQISDKIEIHLDLIVGLPHDYLADIKYSFEEVFKLFAPELQLGFLKFLKGTPIRMNYQEHSYQFDPLPPYQVIQSKYLTKAEIEEVALVEDSLDMYWNKKRALHTLKYIALTYSIYDFLYGLGLYYQEKRRYRQSGLIDLYNSIYEFSMQNYPGNVILQELITLDYYLQHKVKPGIRFLSEINKEKRVEIYDKLKLNHHKYRYILHDVHFSIKTLCKYGIIESSSDLLIIEFTGIDKPRIILQNN